MKVKRKGINKVVRRLRKKRISLKKRVQGSVSLFLLVIMFPMLVFSFTVVDICKIFMAKDVVRDAADVAVNSGLTSYDRVLKDLYGILATSQSEDDLSKKMSEYYVMTLELNGGKVDSKDNQYVQNFINDFISNLSPDESGGVSINQEALSANNNFLKVHSEGEGSVVSAVVVPESAASNPLVLKREIVEYMKYRAPVSIASGMLEKIGAFKDLNNQTKATEKKLEFDEALSDINNSCQSVYTLLRIIMSNAGQLEGGGKTFKKIYTGTDNEKDENKCVTNFLFFDPAESFSAADINSSLKKADGCMDKVASAAAMLELAAPYVDAKMQKVSAVSGKTTSELVKALDKLVSEENSGSDSISQYANYSKLSRVLNMADFEKAITDIAQQKNTSSATDKGIELLLGAAGVYDKDYQNGNDFWDRYKEYVSLYKAAEDKYDKLVAKMEKDPKYATTSEENELIATMAGTGSDSAKGVYDDMTKAVENIKSFADELNKKAKTEYNEGITMFGTIYCEIYRQYSALKAVTEDGSIEKLWTNIETAKTKGEEWGQQVEKVQTSEVHTSMSVQQKGETSMLTDITQSEKNNLVSMLEKELARYRAVLSYLDSYMLLGDKKVVPNSTKSSAEDAVYKYKDFVTSLRFKLVMGQINRPTSMSSIAGNLSMIVSRPSSAKPSIGTAKWNAFISDMKDNAMYKQIVKIAEPTRETTKDSSAKDKVTEKGKVSTDKNGVVLPDSSSDDKEDDKNEGDKNKDEDKKKDNEDDYKLKKVVKLNEMKDFSAYYKELTGVEPDFDATIENSSYTANAGTDSDDKKTTQNAKNMLKSVGDFFGNLAKAGRDDLYMTEYITNMFSCYTTNMVDGKVLRSADNAKKEDMMSGQKFCEATNWYRHEVEYILYGLDTPEANVAAASGVIFGVRFALNLIYSFTDSEISSFADKAAAAASGLFPLAGPIVKAAIHIGLSIAEAGYDLATLLNAGEVPIYKSRDTWMCKPSTLTKKFAEVVADAAGKAVINAATDALLLQIDSLADAGEEKIDELAKSSEFKDMIDEQTDELRQALDTMIRTPIANRLTQVIMALPKDYSSADLKKQLTEEINKLKSELTGMTVGNDGGVTSMAFNKFLSQYWDDSLNQIIGNAVDNAEAMISEATGLTLASVTSGETESVVDKILKPLDDTFDKVLNSDDIQKKLTESAKEALKKVAEAVKKGTVKGADKISEMFSNEMGKRRNDFSDTKMSDLSLSKAGDNTKAPTRNVINMTYKDYMYVFLAIGFMTPAENNMLNRTAKLISANCAQMGGGSDYTLNKAVTLIGAEVNGSVRTTFFGALYEDGKFSPSLNNKYIFSTKTYMGY